tara:strand:- start:158 stop:457 length:300 start_codon:yes stop_codon:yes gene_type:complete
MNNSYERNPLKGPNIIRGNVKKPLKINNYNFQNNNGNSNKINEKFNGNVNKINEKFNGNGNTKKPVKFNNSKFQNKGNSTGFKKNSGSSKNIKSNRRPK